MNQLLVTQIENDVKKKYQNNKRLTHILGVARLAKQLALKYGCDEDEAYVAGLLHDYCKYESLEEQKKIINDNSIIEKYQNAPQIYHAYSSMVMAKDKFGITNQNILNAIAHHVYGRVNMSILEKILVISDYAEDSREYKECKEVRKILDAGHFNQAMYLCIKYTIEAVLKKGGTPLKEEYDVLNQLKDVVIMDLLKLVKESLDKVKATDIKVYDLRGISPLADYSVIATIDVSRQANACVEYIMDNATQGNLKVKNIEGKDSTWILVDLYDVILHIFTKEERENYDLDKLYINIPTIEL